MTPEDRIRAALDNIQRDLTRCPHMRAAACIASVYGDKIRFCLDTQAFACWDDDRWVTLGAAEIIDSWIVRFIIERLQPHMVSLTPFARQNMLDDGYINHVVNRLRKIRKLHCLSTDFDADAYLLGTPSGVVDLRNGRIVKARPEHMISLITGAPIAGRDDEAPQWAAFIEWFTRGDKELARFLRMWLGGSLIGNSWDQKMVFLWGNSDNGKSVLLEVAGLAAGRYHAEAKTESFMVQRNKDADRATPGLVRILAARMVTGTEIPKGAEWDTQKIKQLCSNEAVAMRRLFEAEIAMRPRCSITLAGNDLPALTGLDAAIRRRFVTVHCRAKIAEVDKRLGYAAELFEAEGPGIMRWLVQGALDKHNHGFFEPESVKAASLEYFDSEDVLAQFIADSYEPDGDSLLGTTEMFQAWQAYNKGLGRPRDLTMTSFSLRLQALGFNKVLHPVTRRSMLKGLKNREITF